MSGFQSWILFLTLLVLALVLTLGTNLVWLAGHKEGYKDMQVQAIEHEYALHCPVDGTFAWNGECEE